MPRSNDYIEGSFTKFNQQFSLIKEVVAANTAGTPPVWAHIPTSERDKLEAAWNDWSPKHSAAESPERTHGMVAERVTARARVEPIVRKFCQRFLYDYFPNPVTAAHLESMLLRLRDTARTPIGRPTMRVIISIEPSKTRTHRIRWHVDEDNSTAMPHGTNGWVLAYKVLEHDEALPTDPDEFGHSVLVTRNPYTVELKSEFVGKRIAYCGAFQNSKGEKGDWGEIIIAVCS